MEVAYKEELFAASCRTEIDLGWKALYTSKKNNEADNEEGQDKEDNGQEENNLPPMKKNDNVDYVSG